MIDTHTHISKKYYDDIESVISRANDNGVKKIIISGCDLESNTEAVELIKKYDCLYATIGYHPDEVGKVTDKDFNKLENLVLNSDKIVGIGEIGLDYYYGKDNKREQIDLFEKQLALAEKLDIPVVIHTRDAFLDTYEILKKYKVRGIIHCFSGSLDVANKYIDLGFLLGIGGVLTFKNSKLKDVVENISLENIVLETDAPYLTPVPFRGKPNETSYVIYVAKFIAEIKNIDISEVDKITTNNAFKLFDLQ